MPNKRIPKNKGKVQADTVDVVNSPAAWFGMVPTWISDHADTIGAEGIAVFTVLCFHANKQTSETHPSQTRIAKMSGISRTTVKSRLKLLEKLGIIRKLSQGKYRGETTSYEIVDWLIKRGQQATPLEAVDNRKGSAGDPVKGSAGDPERGREVANNIPIEQTHITDPTSKADALQGQDVTQVILSAFYDHVNKAVPFGHAVQRKAAKKLDKLFGVDKVVEVIEVVLPITNGQRYAPTVTTPSQLLANWAKLQAFIQKAESAKPKVAVI